MLRGSPAIVLYSVEMPEGTVKFFNRAKGFGFIVPDDGGKEIFLPPVAVSEAGIMRLSPGQRVAFEVTEDPKGPKATALKVLGEAPVKPPAEQPRAERPQAERPHVERPQPPRPPQGLSLYCDPASDVAQDVIAALEESGRQVQVIDITTQPPSVLQLKKWAQMMGAKGLALVRRSASLFFDLQLDDRFITEDEFWTAVVQHPKLISGPILAGRDRVRICRTADDVKAFFSQGEDEAVARPKQISPRLAAMMRGETPPPAPPPEDDEGDEDDEEDDEEEEDEDDEELEPAVPEPVAQSSRSESGVEKKTAASPKAVKAKPAAKAPAKKPVAAKAAAKKIVKKK